MNTNKQNMNFFDDGKDELNEIAPFLSKIPKMDFQKEKSIPFGYFDNFPNIIMAKIPKWEKTFIEKISQTIALYLNPSSFGFGFASLIMIIFGISLILNSNRNNNNIDISFNNTPHIKMERILDNLSEDVILESMVDKESNTLKNQALETYLLDNIDQNLLNEEL